MAHDAEIEALKRQVAALLRERTFNDHWRDTKRSHWWKRLWWFVQGFRLCSLGRWYRASWNVSAEKYEDGYGD